MEVRRRKQLRSAEWSSLRLKARLKARLDKEQVRDDWKAQRRFDPSLIHPFVCEAHPSCEHVIHRKVTQQADTIRRSRVLRVLSSVTSFDGRVTGRGVDQVRSHSRTVGAARQHTHHHISTNSSSHPAARAASSVDERLSISSYRPVVDRSVCSAMSLRCQRTARGVQFDSVSCIDWVPSTQPKYDTLPPEHPLFEMFVHSL